MGEGRLANQGWLAAGGPLGAMFVGNSLDGFGIGIPVGLGPCGIPTLNPPHAIVRFYLTTIAITYIHIIMLEYSPKCESAGLIDWVVFSSRISRSLIKFIVFEYK